jgi:hypothetical protein
MEAKGAISGLPEAAVVIEPGRASTAVILGAVDAALRSDLPAIAVRVDLPAGDPRHEALNALTDGDARVTVGSGAEADAGTGLVFRMPARARPQSRTLAVLAATVRDERLGAVDVPVPGRYPALARLAPHGTLRASAGGSGSRRLSAADVGLRSVATPGQDGPPPKGALAAERAEHLRHRARSATMRARMDRNAHRLSRERLQTRHERARLRLAERRLARSGAGEWVRWRSRNAARRAAGIPGAVAAGGRAVRVFGRRARRSAVDRWRSRKLEA